MDESLSSIMDKVSEVPITNEQMEYLLLLQQAILGKLAVGNQHQETLDDLCRSAESMLPNAVASIMLFTDDKNSLTVRAAPNIPIEASKALNGLIPGEYSGSCGTAVYRNVAQFVSNTKEDTRWAASAFQDFAKIFGINACWSMPIRGDNKLAIGSFALSSMEKRNPQKFHKKLLETCADIVAIILKREAEEKQLKFLAHYDALTGLPNRTLFADRFNQAIAHSKRSNSLLAICFLDLDNFKAINDNYGHDAGDKLLIEVAKRITATIRDEDTVSRQGGDEFTLLLRDIDSPSQCEKLLERINHSLAQSHIINGRPHKVSASIGTTLYPLDNTDLDTLIRHADQAMYHAKLSGKNQQQLFNILDDQQIIQRQERLSEIQQALKNKQFELYYQPKVNMKTGQIVGVEALIRWIHPDKGLIPPLDFLPLIDGTEIEIQLGAWVINEALQQLDDWQKQGINLEMSINISSHHIQSLLFLDQLNEALDKHPDVNSQDFQLEILESSALGDIETINGIIKSCRNVLGVNVALDDFGTGYSSLTHMKNLSANIIKIDQSFVRDLLDDPDDFSIIEGIIGLSHAFNREVIAEGVETDAHGIILLLMGCELAQGYGISHPLPATELLTWLANYTPNQYWLDHAKKHLSLPQKKIILLQLTTQHWFNRVKKELLTMEDSGFGKFFIQCHLGMWLSRVEQKELFDPTWVGKLKKVHDLLFSLADKLIKHHQAGKIGLAKEGINELELAYEQVCTVLAQQRQNHTAQKSFASLITKL